MNISAINCTPIKPQVKFGNVEDNHRQLHDIADEYTTEAVDGKDIKRPLAIVASLAALAGVAYGGGKKAASLASNVYKAAIKPTVKNVGDDVAKAAKEGADDVAKAVKDSNLGVVIENGLKKASKIATTGIAKLKIDPQQTTVLSKKDIIKNKTADILEKGLNLAKAGYKKIAYSGIADDVVGADRAQKAFENVAGAVGLATVVPEIISRDANEDGVKDILQKSQNAYTSTEEKIGQVAKDLGTVTDIVQMFT